MKKLVTFILPVYNEEEVIHEFFRVLKSELNSDKYDYEIIFINDGSSDSTLDKLVQIQKNNKNVKVINFSRNFGHQIALTAGLDYASGDAAIIMDTDLQDPPKVVKDLLLGWEKGFEIVYAQRKNRDDGLFKKYSAFFFYRILNSFSEIKIPNDTGDFRLIDRKVIDAIKMFREKNRYMRGLFTYVGFKQTAIFYQRDKRYAGKTNYTFGKMMSLAFDGITGFSTIPLKIITQVGFFVSFLSFLGIIYAVVLRIFFQDITVPGWTLTIISILFIGGIQLLTLGIVGLYIGKIYAEVKERPLYIISSILESTTTKRK